MRRLCLPLLVVAILAGPARAQRIEVPDTVVSVPTGIGSQLTTPAVAAGIDGTMLFVWRDRKLGDDNRFVYGHRFSAAGLALAPPVRLDDNADASDPRIAASSLGGYVAIWRRFGSPRGVNLRRLDASGAPVAPSTVVVNGQTFRHELVTLPSGTIVVWRTFNEVKARLFDTAGQPRGLVFTVATAQQLETVAVAATNDGGFVVVWADESGSWGRRYDGGGVALGAASALTDAFTVVDVAGSPLGGFVIVGPHDLDSHTQPSGVWGRRFDGAGAPAGLPFLVDARPPTTRHFPQAEIDAVGNLYVAWGESGSDIEPIHARAYDAAGRPLGPAFRVTFDTAPSVATAVRPDGRMVTVWQGNDDIRANVIALCAPPSHNGCGDGVVSIACERCDHGAGNSDTIPDACRTTCQLASCGDGVVDTGEQCDDGNAFGCDGCDAACDLEPGYVCGDGVTFAPCGEECDAGAANSDTTPDACRTHCLLPVCGDDVVDSGELCDDGNLASCDGCSAICVAEPGLVCGDGIPELACNEQCDDGNAIAGDGCTQPCKLERIPGGGSARSECLAEWSINNPSNLPLYDKHGAISGVQSCVDGDPQCDFDGAVSGTCTFALRVCVNNTEVDGCEPPTRLSSWELTSPSVKKAERDPTMAAVRAAFTAVPGGIVGPTSRNVCSDTIAVALPLHHGKAGRLVLKTRALSYEDERDVDKLKLVCLPAPG